MAVGELGEASVKAVETVEMGEMDELLSEGWLLDVAEEVVVVEL